MISELLQTYPPGNLPGRDEKVTAFLQEITKEGGPVEQALKYLKTKGLVRPKTVSFILTLEFLTTAQKERDKNVVISCNTFI